MDTVLLHDWLNGFRGGERVLEAFCEMYPDAPLYTLFCKKGSSSEIIESHQITSSFLDKLPGIYTHSGKFLPLLAKACDSLKIKEHPSLVLSSSQYMIKAVKKPEGSKHICYIHSPMRFLYRKFETESEENAPLYIKAGSKVIRESLTEYDLKSNSNVDLFIANSEYVKQRIKKLYNIEAKVVHPFVETKDFKEIQQAPLDKQNYFVILNGMASNKKVDLAIDSFNKLNLKLKVIGTGSYDKMLKERANKNIEFLGELSRKKVIKCLAKAQALIFPGIEDFGIVPLEAMACGTPIIAFKEGGVLETITDKVGTFFENQTVEDLCKAVEAFKLSDYDRQLLIQRSEEFSKNKFVENMRIVINEEMVNE